MRKNIQIAILGKQKKVWMTALESLTHNTTNGIISILLTNLLSKSYENHDHIRLCKQKKPSPEKRQSSDSGGRQSQSTSQLHLLQLG